MDFNHFIPKALKDMVFEEDVKPTATIQTPVLPNLTSSSFAQNLVSPGSTALDSAIESGAIDPTVYEMLRSRTDFDVTEIGKKLKAALDTLADSGLPDSQKLNIALKFAASSGVNSTSIQQELQNCLNKLEDEKKKFDMSAAKALSDAEGMTALVNQYSNEIHDLESKIEEARKNQAETTAQMIQKKSKVEQGKANFSAAYDRRKQDLTKLVAHYSS